MSAWISYKKLLVVIVVINRKAWSTYHYIHDHIVLILISTYSNLLGSDTMTVNRTTSRLDKCGWIEFSFNLFKSFYPYRVLLYIFRLSCQEVTKKGTCYDVINVISFQSLWIYLNEKYFINIKLLYDRNLIMMMMPRDG